MNNTTIKQQLDEVGRLAETADPKHLQAISDDLEELIDRLEQTTTTETAAKTATKTKDITDRNLDDYEEAVYKLSPPFKGHTYVVAGAGTSTIVWSSSPEGQVNQYCEVLSVHGKPDPAAALLAIGYEIASAD